MIGNTLETDQNALGAPRVPLVDPEYHRWALSQYEVIRARRNRFRGVPDQYDRLEIVLDRIFESFYKKVLTNKLN